MDLRLVTSESLLIPLRDLFREYQDSLDIDLCFQDFEQELATLPGKYEPPKGRLYIAFHDQEPAGCIALRPFQGSQSEMKRLYVRPSYRGLGLAKTMIETVISDAREIGYTHMLLDTLPSMSAAIKLYLAAGFYDIAPYRFNPDKDTRFLCLDLALSPTY